jgi:membrane-associated phospholipid phosphatase
MDSNLNIALQQLGPALDGFTKALSLLGQEDFFMLLVPFVYWCVDSKWGMRLISLLALSTFTNALFKWACHAPRPYWIDARVQSLADETTYGLPSNHAQLALVLWSYLAIALKKRWAWLVAVILILGISFSRLYLGVHFVGDVLGGWIIGAIVLLAFLWTEPHVAAWLKPKSIAFQVGAAFALSMVMLGLAALVAASISGVSDPASWSALGGPIDPRNPENVATLLGLVFGASAGYALMRRTAPFDAQGAWPKRLARFALGIVVVLALRFGLGAIFPSGSEPLALVFRYLRYTLIGLWLIWLAPWAFVKLRLAEQA